MAARLFRQQDGFESALAGLEGVREAIRHRVSAIRQAPSLPYRFVIVSSVLELDGTARETSRSEPVTWELPAAVYWHIVPQRFRDVDRFRVERSTSLEFDGPGSEEIRVYEGVALVWTKP
jgi:hypothetical protein